MRILKKPHANLFVMAKKPAKSAEEAENAETGARPAEKKAKAAPGPRFRSTAEIPVPEKLVDWIIGQERGVKIVKKAAAQRRNVLLMGMPGTGKSMLAQAMAELMPAEDLEDVLAYPNPNDENQPLVRAVRTYPKDLVERYEKEKVPADARNGYGRVLVEQERMKARMGGRGISLPVMFLLISVGLLLVLSFTDFGKGENSWIFAATILGLFIFSAAFMLTSGLSRRVSPFESAEPKLIVDNTGKTNAPFIDATGARAGALFGDVRHDPLQCIPAGELVLDGTGNPIPIDRLVEKYLPGEMEGDLALEAPEHVLGGRDAELALAPARVVRVFKRRYSGELVKITTRSGMVLRTTPNHPFAFLAPNGRIEYAPAADLTLDMRPVIPERINGGEESTVSKEMAAFLGDLLADAHVSQRHVDFKLKRDFKIRQITEDIRRLGFVPKPREYRGATIISLNSASFIRYLQFELMAKEGRYKFVPPVMFVQKREVVEEFLAHLISLDGYVNPQGQFELFSSNVRFLKQVRALLFRLGVNAKLGTRLDRGYGRAKNKVQHFMRWNHFGFAQVYAKLTFNPFHKRNLELYLKRTSFNKECFDDIVPLAYERLEELRTQTGLSKEKIHQDYWSINPSLSTRTNLTRALLQKVLLKMEQKLGSGAVSELKLLANGDYAFDEIISIEREQYDGFVYNLTTETGNYFVDFVLTHNSGGLGTPAHLRVESGAIHRANKGVLFVDEVSSLTPRSQQDLLTAMQDKKFSITGQSEMSSGALVKTQPVPCDFVLVAAGNLLDMQNMHPALRSRIRGYGYEVYMEDSIPDTKENQTKLVQFVAQEVKKDGKIPHFSKGAVDTIIEDARRKAARKGRLTLKLRELGGLVRAAGDIAREKGAELVKEEHVIAAREVAAPLEQQISRQIIDLKKDYRVFITRGFKIGRVNGLAVLGEGASGLILPIVAEVTPASSRAEGKLIATGKLGEIAKEAVENVSAIVKKHMGKDVSSYDVHIQFIQTYEGVEGDSASISTAVAVLSAMEGIPVDQSVAMTGSLSVRGEVLPVGGVTAKVEAAIEAGCRTVLIPKANADDVYIDAKRRKKVKIIPVANIEDVIRHSMKEGEGRDRLVKSLPW